MEIGLNMALKAELIQRNVLDLFSSQNQEYVEILTDCVKNVRFNKVCS